MENQLTTQVTQQVMTKEDKELILKELELKIKLLEIADNIIGYGYYEKYKPVHLHKMYDYLVNTLNGTANDEMAPELNTEAYKKKYERHLAEADNIQTTVLVEAKENN